MSQNRSFPSPHPNIGAVQTGIDKSDRRITTQEVAFILKTTLHPEHREDPNILKFISAYLTNRDLRQSAKAAGIDYHSAKNLRQRKDISLAIEKVTEVTVSKYGYDANDIVERTKEIVEYDPAELEHDDGSFKESMQDISPEIRRAIKKFKAKNLYDTDENGVKVVVGKLIEVEFYDKMKGIELLSREKNVFKETKRVEHDVSTNMKEVLLESAKRAEARAVRDVEQIEYIDEK